MSEVLRQPKYVPTSWLVAIISASLVLIGTAITFQMWITAFKLDFTTRILALELKQSEQESKINLQDEDLKYRATQLRPQMEAWIKSIDTRLSRIEGRLRVDH